MAQDTPEKISEEIGDNVDYEMREAVAEAVTASTYSEKTFTNWNYDREVIETNDGQYVVQRGKRELQGQPNVRASLITGPDGELCALQERYSGNNYQSGVQKSDKGDSFEHIDDRDDFEDKIARLKGQDTDLICPELEAPQVTGGAD